MKNVIINIENIDKSKAKWVEKDLKIKFLINPFGCGGKDVTFSDVNERLTEGIPVHLWTGLLEKGMLANKMLATIDDIVYSPIYFMARLKSGKTKKFISGNEYTVEFRVFIPSWLEQYEQFLVGTELKIMLGQIYNDCYWAEGVVVERL